MKRLIKIFLFLSLFVMKAMGQNLTNDFDLFIQYLEETHPDPYSSFGGTISEKGIRLRMRGK